MCDFIPLCSDQLTRLMLDPQHWDEPHAGTSHTANNVRPTLIGVTMRNRDPHGDVGSFMLKSLTPFLFEEFTQFFKISNELIPRLRAAAGLVQTFQDFQGDSGNGVFGCVWEMLRGRVFFHSETAVSQIILVHSWLGNVNRF